MGMKPDFRELLRTLENSSTRRQFLGRTLALGCFAAFPPMPLFAANAPDVFPVRFDDVATKAGLTVPTISGDVGTNTYILETNGCGAAFFDYDNDGWMDLFIVNGSRLKEP